MAKSKRKLRQEARDKREAKKFFMIVGAATIVLILLVYLMLKNI